MYRKYLLNLRLSVLHQLRKAKEATDKKSSEKMEIETIESNSESEEQPAETNSSSSTSSSNCVQESEIQIIKVEPHEEYETRRSVIMHTSDISK